MANLTKTLKTQIVNIFGPSPSNKWGGIKWSAVGVGPGNGTWGIKSAGTGGTNAMAASVGHYLTWSKSNSYTATCPTGNVFKSFYKLWSKNNSIALTHINSDKEQFSGNGYNYTFIDRVTNIESSVTNSYTSAAAGSVTYTSASVAMTTWS